MIFYKNNNFISAIQIYEFCGFFFFFIFKRGNVDRSALNYSHAEQWLPSLESQSRLTLIFVLRSPNLKEGPNLRQEKGAKKTATDRVTVKHFVFKISAVEFNSNRLNGVTTI